MSTVVCEGSEFSVDADIVAQGLGIDPADVLEAMRQGRITSLCERGVEEDAGGLGDVGHGTIPGGERSIAGTGTYPRPIRPIGKEIPGPQRVLPRSRAPRVSRSR